MGGGVYPLAYPRVAGAAASIHAELRPMQPKPATQTAEFAAEVRRLRKQARLSQKEASVALSAGDLSVSERALSDYERDTGLPPHRKRAAILRRLRTLAGEDAPSERGLADHKPLRSVPPGGFLVAAEDVPPTPGTVSLPDRGVELAGARIVTESHDEAGLQWAVEVRFWARAEPRPLGTTTRAETISTPDEHLGDVPPSSDLDDDRT